MFEIPYDRQAAVSYALRWALGRNPSFYDYSEIGGDCTNFASQCVYAGIGVMNYEKDTGWYYVDANDKSPSWTGVSFFGKFMTGNEGVGPYGVLSRLGNISPGDIIQLGNRDGDFYHTLVLTSVIRRSRWIRYYVCSHSQDAYQRNLFSYRFARLRCIHIIGGRME